MTKPHMSRTDTLFCMIIVKRSDAPPKATSIGNTINKAASIISRPSSICKPGVVLSYLAVNEERPTKKKTGGKPPVFILPLSSHKL